MTTLTLPFPPGVNNLYFNVPRVGRVMSERYKAWQREALTAHREQLAGHVAGSFRLTFSFDRPDYRRRDLDGLLKAPIDFLVKAGVVEDDHLCQAISLSWSKVPAAKPGAVHVTVEAA